MHADELADLLRWCVALSTEPAELAGAVMLAAGPRLPQLVNSTADLRELTVHTFLRTPERTARPPRDGIDRIPEELRVVVTAYDKLPKLQRAIVMLNCLEGITYAEIAGIVDRSTARVSVEIDRALVTINADPYAVRAALDMATWHLPNSVEAARALRRHATVRARRTRRFGLAGMAAVTALVGLISFSAVHRPYVEPRKSGTWTFSHTVRAMPEWSIRSRTVERDWETTILRADPPSGARCSVAVGARQATWIRQLPRDPVKVRVGARSAFFAQGVWPNRGGAMLWWEYADGALVIIECGGVSMPRKALPKIANHVVLIADPVVLPYRIRSLPQHYHIASVTKGLLSNSTVAYLTRNDYPEGMLQISIRYPAGLPMYGVSNSELLARYVNGRYGAVCRPFGDSHVCVRGEISSPDRINIADQRGALSVIDQIVASLQLASSPTDPTSWFDAREALPS
jgi:hypothetical protein